MDIHLPYSIGDKVYYASPLSLDLIAETETGDLSEIFDSSLYSKPLKQTVYYPGKEDIWDLHLCLPIQREV